MHFTALLTLALCVFTSAVPLSKHATATTQTVLHDISSISSDVSTLSKLVKSYNGTASQAASLTAAVNCLESKLKTATNDTTAASPFNEADSKSIVDAIQTVSNSAISVIQALDAKHDVFKAAGQVGAVESALGTLQTDTNNFLTAVTDGVTADEEGNAATVGDMITYAFNQAITTYSK